LRQPYSDEIGSATQGLSRTLIRDTGGTAFPRRTASQRARFEELDGVDHLPPFGDADAIVREIGSPLLSRETIGIITSIAVAWVSEFVLSYSFCSARSQQTPLPRPSVVQTHN
jgi:hypothetical protein